MKMSLPGFTAEASLQIKGLYCMATAYNPQNASANVQPAARPRYCKQFALASLDAYERGDDGWAAFWGGAWVGACGELPD
jgi:hypothetical protein